MPVIKSTEAVIIMSRSRNSVNPLFALLAIGAVISGANAKPPSRIYGGRLAVDGEFSAAVTLARPGDFTHTCGGAIIGPRHVLTAAHCATKRSSNEIIVRAGIHDIRNTTDVVERVVSKVIPHPNYVSFIKGQRPVEYDFAILVLQDALPLGTRIQAFRLPTHEPDAGSYFIAGWGQNQPEPTEYQFELKTLTMQLGDESLCQNVPETICTTSDSGAVCPGDSGSPLTKNGYIYGIASTSNCEVGGRAHFANVYYYLSWINEKIAEYP